MISGGILDVERFELQGEAGVVLVVKYVLEQGAGEVLPARVLPKV